MTRFFAPATWTLATLVLLAGTAASRADVIYASTDDSMPRDTTGDDVGDQVIQVSQTSLYTGDANKDVAERRPWVPFALDASQRTAIATAQTVSFKIRLASTTGIADYDLDLLGFDTPRTSTSASKSDYDASATVLKDQFAIPSTTTGSFISADVTQYAKTQAAAGNNTVIAFRLQLDPADLPNNDEANNYYRFNSANSTNGGNDHAIDPKLVTSTIPEPSAGALMLAGIGVLLGLPVRSLRQR